MLFDGQFTEPWGESETRESRFCFIGKNLDREKVFDIIAHRALHLIVFLMQIEAFVMTHVILNCTD